MAAKAHMVGGRSGSKKVSNAQRLLSGVVWIYGGQIGTAAIQFLYAMVTSRLVSAAGFEDYGVALAVFGLASLLANAGLAQSVSRLAVLEKVVVRGLLTYSLLLGIGLSVFLLLTADVWAQVWGVIGAAKVVRVLAIGIFALPSAGLLQGVSRRSGHFRFLSLALLAANVIGMVVGLVAIWLWRDPATLAVSMVVGQWSTLTFFLFKYRHIAGGLASPGRARSELGFAWKLLGASLLGYFNGNIGKFAVTNALAGGALGYWNRADVLTTVPLMQVQNAMVSAAYPEFRHAQQTSETSVSRWTDMLLVAAWTSCPVGVVLSGSVPLIVPSFFGPGWAQAAALAGPLAIVGGLQIPATLLSSAIESLGRFRFLVVVQLLLGLIYCASAVGCFMVHEWTPIILGLLAAPIVQHGIQVWWAGRSRLVSLVPILWGYSTLIGVCIVLYFAVNETASGISSGSLANLCVGIALLLALLTLLGATRKAVPLYAIASRRGLMPKFGKTLAGARHLRVKR